VSSPYSDSILGASFPPSAPKETIGERLSVPKTSCIVTSVTRRLSSEAGRGGGGGVGPLADPQVGVAVGAADGDVEVGGEEGGVGAEAERGKGHWRVEEVGKKEASKASKWGSRGGGRLGKSNKSSDGGGSVCV
jgi:hypothetical protein